MKVFRTETLTTDNKMSEIGLHMCEWEPFFVCEKSQNTSYSLRLRRIKTVKLRKVIWITFKVLLLKIIFHPKLGRSDKRSRRR